MSDAVKSEEAPADANGMSVEAYLAAGGVLTSPGNAPPRYRAELMRIMTSFVDSELAGAAGFADVINCAPGIKQRIAAARIVLEKTDHAGRVLGIMESFGADIQRYANAHPWTARVERDADIGPTRTGNDMRLSVFHYPLRGWVDAVVMNVLMGSAVTVQLGELARVSYQPLAEAFRSIEPRERRHAELGIEGLRALLDDARLLGEARSSIAYWHPRVAMSFGGMASGRFERLKGFGLRHAPNEDLIAAWRKDIDSLLADLRLSA